ncbi:MAG: DUF1329 domain-containing protein [Candidatus Binatia bacterium]
MFAEEVVTPAKIVTVFVLVSLLLPAGGSWAAGEKFSWVKPAPSIEEATGGKLHVGDKITKDNMDAVKQFMPDAMDVLTKDGAEWVIAPVTPSDKLALAPLIEATHKNAGKALVKPDGSVYTKDGGPWIGGFPVLNPTTGVEVMADWLYRDVDNQEEVATEYWTNPAGVAYKEVTAHRRENLMNGRVCVPPVPHGPDTGEYRREMLADEAPYDVKGVSILTIAYQDQSRLPDTWGYIPVLRRVQRFSTGQRYDSLDGSDVRAGDVNIFGDPLGLWVLKLVARKPMLSFVTANSPVPEAMGKEIPRIKGRYRIGAQVELRDTFVIEATPKDPSHIYSKKIMYIDAATYQQFWGTFYDRQGRLWIIGNIARQSRPTRCGNFARIASFEYFNQQKSSATIIDFSKVGRNLGSDRINKDIFTMRFLAAQGR